MTTHKAIRDALATVETICEWTAEGHDVWAGLEPFDMLVGNAEDANDAAFIATCNPAAIRALLADLDAKTAEVERLQALRPVAMTEVWLDSAMRLADDYADACFDQALNQRTEDQTPEAMRSKLLKHLHHGITQKEQGK